MKIIRHVDTGLIAITASLICLLVYLRALSCGFVNFDDQDFVLNNLAIRHLDSNLISYAFTKVPAFSGIWSPLLWISYAIDYQLWGLKPLGYHLTNILLHAFNTSLVVLIADCLYSGQLVATPFLSWSRKRYLSMLMLAGLLFGLHPLRVESVAWISERKDVLNGVFSLGSILFYLRYATIEESPGKKNTAVRYYIISIILFLLSFMAKPVSVVIPVMLMVVDWYPLKRIRKETLAAVLKEKVPYFVLSAAMIILTLYLGGQKGGLLVPTEMLSISQRAVISGNAVFEYLRLLACPVGILPIHILPAPIPDAYTIKTAVVICICVSLCCAGKRPWLVATGLCFLLPLLPVLAFFQTNDVAFAARYTYLPSLAPSIACAGILATVPGRITDKLRPVYRWFLAVLVMTLLVFHGGMTIRLIDSWKDSGTLWSREIAYQPFDKAFFLRGLYYETIAKYDAAADDFAVCLEIARQEKLPAPFISNTLAFRGEALLKAKRYAEAEADLTAAILVFPHPLYFYHRGIALQAMGKLKEAAVDFDKAGTEKGSMRWL